VIGEQKRKEEPSLLSSLVASLVVVVVGWVAGKFETHSFLISLL